MQRVKQKLQLAPTERDAWLQIRQRCQPLVKLVSQIAIPVDKMQLDLVVLLKTKNWPYTTRENINEFSFIRTGSYQLSLHEKEDIKSCFGTLNTAG